MITHNRDITDKKLLELELAEAQSHLTDALSSMADGLALFNPAGELVFSNRRYLEMFPLTADVRVPGNSLTSIIATSLERNEIVMSEHAKETVSDIVGQLTVDSGTREILMSDGRWLQARTRSTRTSGSMVMFSDVSKAKQDERDLRGSGRVRPRSLCRCVCTYGGDVCHPARPVFENRRSTLRRVTFLTALRPGRLMALR